MQQSSFREKEMHGRMEQAKAKEREEARAEEQDKRHQDTRREEAPAQEPGGFPQLEGLGKLHWSMGR